VKLLLDTNVFFRLMVEDHLVSLAAKAAIADLNNQVRVSPVCIWEISIKSLSCQN
jgi:PIN domain nuclease of toxin-antitoxin system